MISEGGSILPAVLDGVETKDIGGISVVTGYGELDLSNVSSLREAILHMTVPGQPLILDFAEVTFADSTVIGALVSAFKRTNATGTPLILVLPRRASGRRVFELTGLAKVLPTCLSLGEATARMRGLE